MARYPFSSATYSTLRSRPSSLSGPAPGSVTPGINRPSAAINQQQVSTDVGVGRFINQQPQWLDTPKQVNPLRPGNWMLAQELAQQFMQQATQLTDQDYPRQVYLEEDGPTILEATNSMGGTQLQEVGPDQQEVSYEVQGGTESPSLVSDELDWRSRAKLQQEPRIPAVSQTPVRLEPERQFERLSAAPLPAKLELELAKPLEVNLSSQEVRLVTPQPERPTVELDRAAQAEVERQQQRAQLQQVFLQPEPTTPLSVTQRPNLSPVQVTTRAPIALITSEPRWRSAARKQVAQTAATTALNTNAL